MEIGMEVPMQVTGGVGVGGGERHAMPNRQALRTWAGHGSGATCNGCGDTITAHDIEYEVEVPAEAPGGTLHFHFVCYRSWTGRAVR
jgi:hypothetical protein